MEMPPMLLPYSDNLSFIFMFTLWWSVWRFATRFRQNTSLLMCEPCMGSSTRKSVANHVHRINLFPQLCVHSHDLELQTIVSADPVRDHDTYLFPLPILKRFPCQSMRSNLHTRREVFMSKGWDPTFSKSPCRCQSKDSIAKSLAEDPGTYSFSSSSIFVFFFIRFFSFHVSVMRSFI